MIGTVCIPSIHLHTAQEVLEQVRCPLLFKKLFNRHPEQLNRRVPSVILHTANPASVTSRRKTQIKKVDADLRKASQDRLRKRKPACVAKTPGVKISMGKAKTPKPKKIRRQRRRRKKRSRKVLNSPGEQIPRKIRKIPNPRKMYHPSMLRINKILYYQKKDPIYQHIRKKPV